MLVSRAAAKAAGSSRYFTGEPCKRGHVCERVTANSTCVECYRASHSALYQNDPLRLEKKRALYERNKESVLASCKEYRARNAEQISARKSARDAANRPAISAAHKAWRNGAGRHKALAIHNERRRRHRQQTPPWSDRGACKAFYEIASRVTACTGIPFEVDHIIPLAGELVSGLHVPTNLQVIPAHQNRKKGNRTEALVDWHGR